MTGLLFLIYIVAFMISVILHEIAHGFAADVFGDKTARMAGRLSFNPIVHIDPVGSILVPMVLMLSQPGFLFGWAKPVPVNTANLRGGVFAFRWVCLAGIVTNLTLAVISALVLKVVIVFFGLAANNLGILFFTALLQVNIVLAVFNLIPLPGFDGFNFFLTFKPVFALVGKTPLGNPLFMARWGLLISILLIFLFSSYISWVIAYIFAAFLSIFRL